MLRPYTPTRQRSITYMLREAGRGIGPARPEVSPAPVFRYPFAVIEVRLEHFLARRSKAVSRIRAGACSMGACTTTVGRDETACDAPLPLFLWPPHSAAASASRRSPLWAAAQRHALSQRRRQAALSW